MTARAVVGSEYITNYEEIRGVVWDNRHSAAEIKAGVAYRFSTNGINKLYFKFSPDKTRIYRITLIKSKENVGGAALFLNSRGEQIGETYRTSEQDDVEVKLEANNVYYEPAQNFL